MTTIAANQTACQTDPGILSVALRALADFSPKFTPAAGDTPAHVSSACPVCGEKPNPIGEVARGVRVVATTSRPVGLSWFCFSHLAGFDGISSALAKHGSNGSNGGGEDGFGWIKTAVFNGEAVSDRPKVLIPGLLWAGAKTLLAAPPKLGKSTLFFHGLAALHSGEPFLGEKTPEGDSPKTLIVSEMEAGMVSSWLKRHGLTATANVFRARHRPVEQLAAAIVAKGVEIVIVDTVTALAAAQLGRSNLWNGLDARRLVEWVPDGVAALFVHHVRKSDGEIRDSSDFAASVDQVVRMTEDGTSRKLAYIGGRWDENDRYLTFDERSKRYELGSMPLEPEDLGREGAQERVSRDVQQLKKAEPGISLREVQRRVTGRNDYIRDAYREPVSGSQDRWWDA